MQSKSELLDVLHADNEQGIAFNQSGIPLQLMDYRDFLDWYKDAGRTRITFEDVYNDETDTIDLYLYERSCADSSYAALERRYNDDNGTGGIYYTNTNAIARLQDEKDEWQELFAEEDSIS